MVRGEIFVMWNMYHFSFDQDNKRVGCIIEAGSSYEAISTFWKEYPNATNVELDGGGVNNNYGEIKSKQS